ncbi:glycosyltransferase involved in cell wall biosynthesis [Pantoea alhagi]|uniref:glycosyltransferase n=1 Tax=Mixta sp. BE291 TaxID=3158787 RepID=UPI00285C1E17|nr:glycosyltransferase involved in cell wall biosynthesis [Pantoea alhagi]
MKILHVTNRLTEGGVETYLLNLLPALVSAGYEVDLMVLDKNQVALAENFKVKNIRVIVGNYSSVYNPLNILLLIKIIGGYDLIHSHLFPTQYFLAFANLFHRKKLVTTEHCTTNKRRRSLFKPLEYIVYSLYHSIVGVSKASSSNIIKWLPSIKSKVLTILNGIDIKNSLCNDSVTRQDLGLSEEKFLIVMTARFFDQKDHDTLIRALSYLPLNMQVVFIGSGVRLENCQLLAKQLNVAERCLFLGRRSDVTAIIKLADLCVLSTHYEGLPISVIEYMAAGKPVIATNVDGVDEMINSQCLVNKKDAQDLAAKILLLEQDKALCHKLAQENLVKAQEYDLATMNQGYISLYEKLSSI